MHNAKIAKTAEIAEKKLNCIFFFALFAVFAIFASSLYAAAATTQVSPEAADVLEKVKQAYSKLKTLEQTGVITGEFDVDGQQNQEKINFVSSFAAPNLFKIELNKNHFLGSNGQRIYVYLKNRNIFYA